MPTYEFRCPDGTIIERIYKISEAPSEIPSPNGDGMAVRIISGGAGLLFKGSGFYITDYGKDGKKDQRAASGDKDGKSEKESSSEKERKTDKDSAATAPQASTKTETKSSGDSSSSSSPTPSLSSSTQTTPAPAAKPDRKSDKQSD